MACHISVFLQYIAGFLLLFFSLLTSCLCHDGGEDKMASAVQQGAPPQPLLKRRKQNCSTVNGVKPSDS